MAENLSLTFRSIALLALALLAPMALVFLIARERHRIRLAHRFISESLRGIAYPARKLRPYLGALAILAAAVALAGPRAGYKVMPVEERASNRVIAIDVSDSMGARDVGASRLDAAKAIATNANCAMAVGPPTPIRTGSFLRAPSIGTLAWTTAKPSASTRA